jgi:SAM-dependent methyltransferase
MSGTDWYDEALYYDVLFAWDASRERDFLLEASARFGLGRAPARCLEPFCGTGRLLKLMPGAVGFDLSPAMLAIARAKGCRVFRADAGRFAVAPGSVDLAYTLIDSFRHLLTEEAARGFLDGVARALRPGGVFVLGFDITGGLSQEDSLEEWETTRDGIHVKGRIEVLGDADPVRRVETMRVRLDVKDKGRPRTVESRQPLRTYTPAQALALVSRAFEVAGIFDRRYDLTLPQPIEKIDGSAVFVLRAARS